MAAQEPLPSKEETLFEVEERGSHTQSAEAVTSIASLPNRCSVAHYFPEKLFITKTETSGTIVQKTFLFSQVSLFTFKNTATISIAPVASNMPERRGWVAHEDFYSGRYIVIGPPG